MPKPRATLNRSISDMHELAISRGGVCTSIEYKNSQTKLGWKCSQGHEWKANPNKVQQGRWCPECAKKTNGAYRKHSLKHFQDFATKRGGKCLTKFYENSAALMSWTCEKGHSWEASGANIIYNKSWCPFCAGVKRHTIEKFKQLAKERSGECLSSEYINRNTPLLWRCKESHEWRSKPSEILSGCWCPQCATGLYERICRSHLEQLTGQSFPL